MIVLFCNLDLYRFKNHVVISGSASVSSYELLSRSNIWGTKKQKKKTCFTSSEYASQNVGLDNVQHLNKTYVINPCVVFLWIKRFLIQPRPSLQYSPRCIYYEWRRAFTLRHENILKKYPEQQFHPFVSSLSFTVFISCQKPHPKTRFALYVSL